MQCLQTDGIWIVRNVHNVCVNYIADIEIM